MNTTKYMIIIKGEIKTRDVKFLEQDDASHKMNVTFNNRKTYSYTLDNVEFLENPKFLDPRKYHLSKDGKNFFSVEAIYEFVGKDATYIHVCFKNNVERDYYKSQLDIQESYLNKKDAANVFDYIKETSKLSNLKNESNGEQLLPKKFKKISFLRSDVALTKYLNPKSLKESIDGEYMPIFPFGCNNSQYVAVKRAMENQISVIQGPPGTGKTQTILNIIANILIQGKTVQVVSNNNSATENVFEKLSSSKYNLGFIVATLGKSDNKTNFINNQKTNYPDFTSWKSDDIQDDFMQQVQEKSKKLKTVFDKQERLAQLNQELNRLKIERKYFNEYLNETNVTVDYTKYKRSMKSNKWMKLWQECQSISEVNKDIDFFLKLKFFFKYGLYNFSIYSLEISQIITTFQAFYYETRENEILKELDDITAYLNNTSNHLLDNLTNDSMKFLKNYLANKYEKNTYRQLFTSEDFLKNPYDILNEYPVILSTTFSSRDSLNDNVVYDYVIMDEASQVDIATGALAMSCAKNMVIVGDTNQLPNVVDKHTEIRADVIFNQYNLSKGYRFTNSFLQSVLEVMPNVTQTMLREHYRCHPKIIEFCNQKFYRGNLIIMTEDHGEKDVLKVIKTVKGNHSRNHFSQRQIDIIKNEIIPNDITNKKETGIISPYNNQVQSLKEQIDGIEQATVHKFQGKEKDTIIISTVEDEITDFVDDPYLLNVAVSRAKKKLILVVTGNEQNKERNIMDLIDYIQYNNFEVVESNVYSIFDYLYKQYTKERKLFLNKNNRKLEYDSENLMYTLLEEILKNDDYKMLDFVCHFPVNMLIKNPYLLNDDECLYAMNPATHVDFLVYNRISKRAILAIEVDGYAFHQKETAQAKRDLLKNHIFELYYIPLLRFSTTGSGEREKIINMLNKILNIGDLK
ncbi:AAA domain-containing protein [Faecalibacillus intestinalis]|uniref:AAA domain-containing protein n=1 Tax=Faecalibacillus intestinalis TaxID=1982626 RepID=UPI00295E632E|nr:AAA domain-containing protein [Faecalibacillus intestinalis]